MKPYKFYNNNYNIEDIDNKYLSNIFFCLYDINLYTSEIILENKFSIDLSKDLLNSIYQQMNIYIKDNFLSFVLIHEFNIAKDSNILKDDDYLRNFVFLTNTKEWREYLSDKYPLLIPRLETVVNNIVSYYIYFVKSFNLDKDLIFKYFSFKSSYISNIELFKGDVHKNGSYVLSIIFNDNTTIYFKPRSSKIESFFKEFVGFIDSEIIKVDVSTPKILNFDDRSWMSEIKYSSNFNNNNINYYYHNLGKLLAIFYVLGSNDIIPDNYIISENTPAFFDLECLFSKPLISEFEKTNLGVLSESVMKSGILPEWFRNMNLEKETISSLLFSLNKQYSTKYTLNKDLEYKSDYINKGDEIDSHLPYIGKDYCEVNENTLVDFISGFKKTYIKFYENKSKIDNFISNSNLKDISIRYILHHTAIYSQLSRESITPESFQETTNLKELIVILCENTHVESLNIKTEIIADSIFDQIINGDIPFYSFKENENLIKDGLNNTITELNFNIEEYVHDKIKKMNITDLNYQVNLINNTVQFAFDYFSIKEKQNYIDDNSIIQNFLKKDSFNIEKKEFNNTILLNTAKKIADDLLEKVNVTELDINWPSKVKDVNDNYYHISLLNLDLYEGLTGLCLFYYNMYINTLESKYNKIAFDIFTYIHRVIKQKIEENFYYNKSLEDLKNMYVSPFYFPSCFIYLFINCNKYQDDNNKKTLEDLIPIIIHILNNTSEKDFIGGKLGLISLLLDVKSFFNSNIERDLDKSIIDNLNNIYSISIIDNKFTWKLEDINGSNETPGFAHGSSSVYSIFYKAFIIYNNNRYKEMAMMALNHERSFFDKELCGWNDNRNNKINIDSIAWCHGSTGIGLSRILNFNYHRDEIMVEELTLIKNNILQTLSKPHDHSICHGALGNLEVLKCISIIMKDNELNEVINNYLIALTNNYNNLKFGSIGNTEILGLFLGKSGFGYQLIRFFNWENTPSVLALETSYNFNKNLH